MKAITEKVQDIFKKAVEKDLSFIEDKVRSFKSIEDVVEIDTHFYDFESLSRFFEEVRNFLQSYEHFIPRIEGTYRYESEGDDEECNDNDIIYFGISGGGDDVYDWSNIFKVCTKNTLRLIKGFGGKVLMTDYGGEWTF